MSRKRIAAVVMNSVSSDTRVLKEADSLGKAGFEVAIFGIQDNRDCEPRTDRPHGVRIHRVDWKHRCYRALSMVTLAVGVFSAVAAVLVYILLFNLFEPILTSRIFLFWSGMALFGGLSFFPVYCVYKKSRTVANRLNPGRVSKKARPRRWKRPVDKLQQNLKLMQGLAIRWFRRRCLSEKIIEFRPDVVHCHDLNTLAIGWTCAKRTGCKVIFDSHELFEETSLINPMEKRICRRRLQYYSQRIDGFITINESIADYHVKRYPRLPTPVIVKNATVIPPELPDYDGRLHRAAGLEPDAKILLYQGGFALRRGLNTLIRSAPFLPDNWFLVMMGWGAFEKSLRNLARVIDPSGQRVRFIPPAPQAELVRWTMGATLGVIPYENVCLNHWFCTPNKLWEYPVAEVPILVSPFPELRRPVQDLRIGRLLNDPVTPRNIARIVASVDDQELATMKENCRSYIAEDHWGKYEGRLVEMYESLDRSPAREREDAGLPVSKDEEKECVGAA